MTRPGPEPMHTRLAPLLPTVAMLVGLVGLRSAWVALLMYHAGIVVCLVLTGARPRGGRFSRWIPLAAGLAGLGGPVLALGWPLFANGPAPLADRLAALGLSGSSWRWFALYYLLINPWLEEAFWRGWLAPATGRVHWHDAVFALYHGVVLMYFIEPAWILVAIATLTAAAWAWRRMVRAWGGLAGPVATHLAADAGIIAAARWLMNGS